MNSKPSCPAMLCRRARRPIPFSVTGTEWKNRAGGSRRASAMAYVLDRSVAYVLDR
jgi:hypothetical protein